MGKLFSVIKKGYYGNVVTIMFCEKELLRFYRSQTGARVFLFGKKFLKRSLPEKYLLKNACNNASMQASCFDDIVRQSKKTVVFVIDSMESIGGVEMRLYHEACYLKSIGYEPIIVAKYNLIDKLREFCNIDIIEIFPSYKMKLHKHRLRFSHNIIKPISKIRCLIIQQNIASLSFKLYFATMIGSYPILFK